MENFIVSARKYRPATFASVVGQGHITSTLKNAIARSQLAHAYLFCGPRGVGKTTCARIFAKAINCLNPVESEACGECESCRSFNEGRSFNIHELDAASNNSVDDIRNLTDQVRIPPQIGRYSVYIIDEVHMLSAAAFNAFLKTLEEPPAHALFILATTEKHKIIPTILSRCQIFDFNRIRVEDGVGYLRYIAGQEGITFDDESLHLIAQKAEGGMRDALSMFDKAVAFCGNDLKLKDVAHTLNILDYDTYFSMVDRLAEGDYRAALVSFDGVLAKGFSGQFFVAGLANHFRDLLMCKNPQTMPLMEVSGTLLERYKKQSEGWPPERLFNATALLASIDGMLRTSSNQRLTIELGLMKLAGLGQKKNDPVASNVAPAGGATSAGDGTASSAAMPRAADYPLPDLHTRKADTTTPSAIAAPPATEKPEPAAVASNHVAEPAASYRVDANQAAPLPTEEKQTAKFSISGESLASILKRPAAVAEQETHGESSAPVDPASEEKITAAKEKFLAQLGVRIAMAFGSMTVIGNKVCVTVPNESLHDEIVRNRTEILASLASIAGVEGVIDLQVEVKEDNSARKPIKVEDKLQFLTQKNPLLDKLRRELELEIE